MEVKLCYLWLEFVESGACGAVSHMHGFLKSWGDIGTFFVVSPKKFSYLTQLKNVSMLGLKTRLMLFIYANFLGYRKIMNIVARQNPEVIYCRHVFLTDISARLARDLKIPLFLEFNGPVGWATKYWAKGLRRYAGILLLPVLNYYEKNALKGATRIFVVSKAMKDIVLAHGIPENKIIINPNGVDINKFKPGISGESARKKYSIPENAIVVGFIGTFGRWHGAEILANAAYEVVQEKDIYFLFMGDGQYRKQAEEAARKSERIIFTGYVSRANAPKYLAACDILVNPTVPNPDGTEFFGSPTKLFEYMAMGKAIISSRLGQMKELLENNKDALLVEAGNHLALKDGIILLARDKKTREVFGKNARKKVIKKYTWKKNAEHVLEAYNELQMHE